MIEQFLKFCIVGGSGVFVDFGITYLCKEWLRLNKYVANSLGFLCASTTNYILNRIWTFHNENPDIPPFSGHCRRGACHQQPDDLAAARPFPPEFLSGQAFRHRRGHLLELLHELFLYVLTLLFLIYLTSIFLMNLAGFPATTVIGGTSLVTTLPAPTMAP